jgi:D-alanyl-D-alanine carboxypeptidase
MSHMRYAALVLAFLGILQSDTTRWAPALDAIDRAVAGSTRPAIIVAITDRERTLGVFAHGYADLKTKKPITADSLFAIGSISKSFTAIALMQLWDEGRFDPEAPIATYLPWFAVKSPYGPITGHHLLTHTAGLPNYRADLASMPFATYALKDFEPSYAPGAHFWYSNLGFQTLGYALERIENVSYPAIIQRRVFDRIGMRSSAAAIDDRARTRLPISYARWPPTGEYVEEPWFEYTAADGSIISTAEDMAAYARMILNRGAAPRGKVLSERAFERLITPALDNYAYGLTAESVDNGTEIRHGGAIAGFGSQLFARLNDGFGVVMLGSAGADSALDQWIVSALKARVRNQPVPEFKTPAPQPAADWAGTFTARDGRTLEFVVDPADRSRLTVTRENRTIPLTGVGPNTFREAEGDPAVFPYVFERRDGKVIEVARGSDWYTRGAYAGPGSSDVPPEYASFVGRYKNHNPEGGPLRVFLRGASLMIARDFNDGGSRLVRVAPSTFRPESPDFNPERYVFDSVVDGHALRVLVSGTPMYRVDE